MHLDPFTSSSSSLNLIHLIHLLFVLVPREGSEVLLTKDARRVRCRGLIDLGRSGRRDRKLTERIVSRGSVVAHLRPGERAKRKAAGSANGRGECVSRCHVPPPPFFLEPVKKGRQRSTYGEKEIRHI